MKRLKVLISAYACEPGSGSEPGVGWNTAYQMAKHHDVWVLTREDNRPAIEAELVRRPVPGLHFAYYDLPRWARWWKKGQRGVQLYYLLWQLAAFHAARRMHREHRFDLAHHATFIRYWTPSLISSLPIPFIWGPVGGCETAPRPFRAEMSARARMQEMLRDLIRRIAEYDPLVRQTARNATIAFANTKETAGRLRALGARDVRVMGEASLDKAAVDYYFSENGSDPASNGRFRFSSMTRLEYWKGVHLGLRAFAQIEDKTATYWILGTGPEEARLRRLAAELGVADRVEFLGAQPRTEWFRRLKESDVLVHPALSNTGNCISLEAMAAGTPVLCLDVGGITSQVTDETGIRVEPENPARTVEALTEAMNYLAQNPQIARRMGDRGSERVRDSFTWSAKARVFDQAYRQSVPNGSAGTSEEDADAVTVVVLGMHRSGTSMTAGILEALGVDMGQELKAANQANPNGFFEDVSFLKMNERILEAAGGDMYTPPASEEIRRHGAAFADEIRTLVERRQSACWGWKDPSTSLTAELYLEALSRPHFIVCHRDPVAVANSMRKRGDRGGMDLDVAMQLVEKYEERIEEFFGRHPDLPRLDLQYRDVLKQPAIWVDRIVEFLRLQTTPEQHDAAVRRVLPKHTVRALAVGRLLQKGLRRPLAIPGYILRRIKALLRTRTAL